MRLSVNLMVEPQSATCAAMPQTVVVPTLISYCNHDSIVLCSYDIVFIACDIVLCALLVQEAAQRSDCLKDERAMCEKKGELVHVCMFALLHC